jgi:hypothetical protein
MHSNRPALTIDEVLARFEEWTKNRQGKTPVLDELRSAAATTRLRGCSALPKMR